MSVGELKHITPMSEFYEWQVILKEDVEENNVLYTYLQRLLHEVIRSNPHITTESRNKLKLSDSRVRLRQAVSEIKKTVSKKLKDKAQASMQHWRSSLGFDKNNKLETRTPNIKTKRTRNK